MRLVLTFIFSLFISLFSFAEADYVYHEASTNTIGLTSLQFRDIMIPNRTQSVKIGFKIEFQFYWNQARIYYTTDGSNPSGAFGVGNGTTQVLTATFDHNFGSPLVDAVFATIPAQPAGTTVKYIVSAWSSGGGDEIFGNGCGNAPRTFCVSDNKLSSQATVFSYTVFETETKKFPTTTTLPVNLNNGSGTGYSTCTSLGNKPTLSFNVTNVGVLSNINALVSINISFNTSCGGNIRDLGLFIKSPSGTCLRIYNGANTTSNASGTVNVVMRDGSCLIEPNILSTWNTTRTSSGNFGVFLANPLTTMQNAFNNQNANGIWTIYVFENGSAPCISNIELVFGDPIVENRLANGENCSNPIIWDGQPLCTQTSGKSGSTQMPGSITGPSTNSFGTISGATCEWNNANNNDVWIKFRSTGSGTVCISVSGLTINQQSIVVKDANRDNDNNPCTQVPKTNCFAPCVGNDPNWFIASCPRNIPLIYTVPSGTSFNQQHCFLTQKDEVFYLVVDGNGGAESPFYITGISGPLPSILPIQDNPFINPPRNKNDIDITVNGTVLKTNVGNKKYNQSIVVYDGLGRIVTKTKRIVTGYSEYDLNNIFSSGFYVIKVLLDDKFFSNFTFKIIK